MREFHPAADIFPLMQGEAFELPTPVSCRLVIGADAHGTSRTFAPARKSILGTSFGKRENIGGNSINQ